MYFFLAAWQQTTQGQGTRASDVAVADQVDVFFYLLVPLTILGAARLHFLTAMTVTVTVHADCLALPKPRVPCLNKQLNSRRILPDTVALCGKSCGYTPPAGK
jgi:hypothetical protein